MKRGIACLLTSLCVAAAVAQVQVKPGGPPKAAAPQPTGPQGEQKLRWVCQQLRLDAAQKQQAEALIVEYHAVMKELEENAAELLQKIQDKFAEIQAAKTAGEADKVKRLQDELRAMAPGAQSENRFFEGLEEILTPEQKARLPELRKQVETVGDISLRPVHIFRVLREFNLTPEQQAKLEKILENFRSAQVATPAKPETQPADAQNQRVEQLANDIRAILLPNQVQEFDRKLEDVRLAPPPAKPIPVPGATTQPGPTPPGSPPPPRPMPPPQPPGQPRP